MKSNVVNHPFIERWSSKRKAELVLEIIKGTRRSLTLPVSMT
jgi:hypothetical protein